MKKYLILMLCILLICAMPVLVYAEGETTAPIETSASATEVTTEAIPEEAAPDTLTTEEIVAWVKAHLEEISVVITLIVTLIYNIRRNAALGKSMTTVNNNAVNIATDSKTTIESALKQITALTAEAKMSKDEISSLLTEIRKNAQEKQTLEATLAEVTTYLKTSKLANMEFADELAELLVLANIPNSKKEELYSRHIAAVNSIAEAEKTEEVVNHEAEEPVKSEAA